MAQGRMLLRKISVNHVLPRLIELVVERMGPEHGGYVLALHAWLIPHLDVEGRMFGDPLLVKGMVMPLIRRVTAEQIEQYLIAMAELDLIQYYERDGVRWIAADGFSRCQPGLRKDREPPSGAPAPPKIASAPISTCQASFPVGAGSLPADIRQASGDRPAEVEDQDQEKNIHTARARVMEQEPASQPAPHQPDSTDKINLESLRQLWLQKTGILAPNLDVAARLIEDLARSRGESASELAPRVIDAFVAYVGGLSIKPSLVPYKLEEPRHWGAVQEVLNGTRDPRRKPPSRDDRYRAPVPDERPYSKPFEHAPAMPPPSAEEIAEVKTILASHGRLREAGAART